MNWSTADSEDKMLLKILSFLYGNNEKLLHVILNPDTPKLIAPSDTIKKRC